MGLIAMSDTAEVLCPCCRHADTVEEGDGLRYCVKCDHMFQYPLSVTAVYDKQYIDDRYEKYPTTEAMSCLRVGFVKGFVRCGSLLDVGYGNGAFVKAAMKAGFDAYGCDVHHADFGVREAPLDKGNWDVVTFFDSLEHFDDLDIIRDLNKRTKQFIISLPARPSWFPRNRNWKHYRPGEHLHYFRASSLIQLFEGKKLIAVSDVEDTIRGKLSDGGNSNNILTVVLTN